MSFVPPLVVHRTRSCLCPKWWPSLRKFCNSLFLIKGFDQLNLMLLYCSFTGEKAEAKCVSNSTNCSCAVTGYPLPSMRKLINGNQTVKISQYGPIIIDPGVTLFAFNAFGDDVFTCPVVTLPTMITTTTTTSPSTTKTSTTPKTTTTTTPPTTLSTTKTTTFSKSTRANTSLAG